MSNLFSEMHVYVEQFKNFEPFTFSDYEVFQLALQMQRNRILEESFMTQQTHPGSLEAIAISLGFNLSSSDAIATNHVSHSYQESMKEDIKEALKEFAQEQRSADGDKLYNVNQVARRLGKAHATIKKMVNKGLIKTTKDGLITESSLNEYINRK